VNRVISRAYRRGREGPGFDRLQKNPQQGARTDRLDAPIDGHPSRAAVSGDPGRSPSCFDDHAHENRNSAVRSPGFVSPAESTRPPSVAGGHFPLEPNRNQQELATAITSELLFVDPLVSDLCTILRNVKPEVEAIMLDRVAPPARQMAVALEGRDGLDAVHFIAHGAPGRVNFAAGGWAAETLQDDENDLAAIGHALGAAGDLRLWSCDVGAGAAGRGFVDALSRAARAPVAAATGLIGSRTLGGDWKLRVRTGHAAAQPPLTREGIMSYAAVFAVIEVTVRGVLPIGNATGNVTYFILDTAKSAIVGQVILPNAVKQSHAVALTVKVPSTAGSLAIGTFDDGGNFQAANFLRVEIPAVERPDGAVGPSGR
jgi:hypothetical protein